MSDDDEKIVDPLTVMLAELDQFLANLPHISRAQKAIYDAYVAEGFTEAQALKLTAAWLKPS